MLWPDKILLMIGRVWSPDLFLRSPPLLWFLSAARELRVELRASVSVFESSENSGLLASATNPSEGGFSAG